MSSICAGEELSRVRQWYFESFSSVRAYFLLKTSKILTIWTVLTYASIDQSTHFACFSFFPFFPPFFPGDGGTGLFGGAALAGGASYFLALVGGSFILR